MTPPFLTSALERGVWSASRPPCFTHGDIYAVLFTTVPLRDNNACKYGIYRFMH
jgi:hypothetical protein